MSLEDYNSIDYLDVCTVDEDEFIACPHCGFEDIFYHNGEYVCLNCDSILDEQEIIDYCGTDIFVLGM